jgi:hypothetical protein
LLQVVELVYTIGLAMTLGTIFTFIAVNASLGQTQDVVLVHHMRSFTATISRMVTVPGAILLLLCSIVTQLFVDQKASPWGLLKIGLCLSILLNSIFLIAPMLRRTRELAQEGMTSGTLPPEYAAVKAREDRYGAANLLLLTALVAVLTFTPLSS